MLVHLRVQNLGVLDDVAIDPAPGLTVVTGETGAGKTLLVGGLRLILGEKPDSAAVGPHGVQAQADGLFIAEEGEVGVTRIVPRDGRSRCLLDGATVSTDAASNLVGQLVEIVSQHDQLSLRRPSHVLSLVDECLDTEGKSAMEAYRAAWAALEVFEERRRSIGVDPRGMARELDLLRYQANEIHAAGLQTGEDDALEAEAGRLRNIEEITEHLAESTTLIKRLEEDGGEIVSRLRKVSALDTGASSVADSAEALAAGIAELTSDIRSAVDGLDVDPERQEEVESRLTLIGELKRKYGRTLEDVLDYGRDAARRAEELTALSEEADLIEERVNRATLEVDQKAGTLREARKDAAHRLVSAAGDQLGALAMGRALLEMRIDAIDPGPEGADRAELWFASDPRLDPAPLSAVASGGELSRLVLAVRLAARRPGSTTLVFDEVDAGVGGATALALGRMLAELGNTCQVLCVTHLAQIAAQGDAHYAIERDGPVATARLVTGDERLAELARMIAGSPESAPGRRTARELLESAKAG